MNTNQTAAQTILAQLGGNRFVAMTGARNFVGDTAALRFALPARLAKDGINKVKVELVADTYTVTFWKLRGMDVKVVAEREMVYADQLRDVFTSVTGLRVSL